MVVGEGSPSSRDRRRSSVSPVRERARHKPRQEWLVTVGQGRSPASTLRRASRDRRNSTRTKKFDTARLSFGGLEQDRKPRRSQSPPPANGGGSAAPSPPSPLATPSRHPREERRPGLSPASAASSPDRRTTTPPPEGEAPSPPAFLAENMIAASEKTTRANNVTYPVAVSRSPSPPRSSTRGLPDKLETGGTTAGPPSSTHGGGCGDRDISPFRCPPVLEPPSPSSSPALPGTVPRVDWLSAAVAGTGAHNSGNSSNRGERVGDADAPVGASGDATAAADTSGARHGAGEGMRDARLNTLLLLSPGKEYWAGRLASKGPRDSSESPRRPVRVRERATNGALAGRGGTSDSPTGAAIAVSSPAGRHQQQHEEETGGVGGDAVSAGSTSGRKTKGYCSFTAGKRGTLLRSPAGGGGGGSSSLPANSTLGLASPGGASGGARSLCLTPTSPSLSPLTPVVGQRRQGFTSATGASARVSSWNGRATASSGPLSPAGGYPCFHSAPSPRFGLGKDPHGAGFNRSTSPPQRKVSRDAFESRMQPRRAGYDITAGKLLSSSRGVKSPSCLPFVTSHSGAGGNVAGDALEGTETASGERVGEDYPCDSACAAAGTAAAGGNEAASLEPLGSLSKGEAASLEPRGAYPYSGVTRLETEDLEGAQRGTLAGPVVAGAGASTEGHSEADLLNLAAEPSSITIPPSSPAAEGPSPSTGDDVQFESFPVAAEDEAEDQRPDVEGDAWRVLSPAAVVENPRPPLHGSRAGFRGHVPPGVRVADVVGAVSASATTSGASSCGDSDGDGGALEGSSLLADRCSAVLPQPPPSACRARVTRTRTPSRGAGLRVGTPKGDGGASDLSLWVTLRNFGRGWQRDEEGKGAGAVVASDGAGVSPSATACAVAGAEGKAEAEDAAGGSDDSFPGGGTGGTSKGGSSASSGDGEMDALATPSGELMDEEDGRTPFEKQGQDAGVKPTDISCPPTPLPTPLPTPSRAAAAERGDGKVETVGVLPGGEAAEGLGICRATAAGSESVTAALLPRSGDGSGSDGNPDRVEKAGHTGSSAVVVGTGTAAGAAFKGAKGARSSLSVDWEDVGLPREVSGGVEGLWRALSHALCGLLSFCHPDEGRRVGNGGASELGGQS